MDYKNNSLLLKTRLKSLLLIPLELLLNELLFSLFDDILKVLLKDIAKNIELLVICNVVVDALLAIWQRNTLIVRISDSSAVANALGSAFGVTIRPFKTTHLQTASLDITASHQHARMRAEMVGFTGSTNRLGGCALAKGGNGTVAAALLGLLFEFDSAVSGTAAVLADADFDDVFRLLAKALFFGNAFTGGKVSEETWFTGASGEARVCFSTDSIVEKVAAVLFTSWSIVDPELAGLTSVVNRINLHWLGCRVCVGGFGRSIVINKTLVRIEQISSIDTAIPVLFLQELNSHDLTLAYVSAGNRNEHVTTFFSFLVKHVSVATSAIGAFVDLTLLLGNTFSANVISYKVVGTEAVWYALFGARQDETELKSFAGWCACTTAKFVNLVVTGAHHFATTERGDFSVIAAFLFSAVVDKVATEACLGDWACTRFDASTVRTKDHAFNTLATRTANKFDMRARLALWLLTGRTALVHTCHLFHISRAPRTSSTRRNCIALSITAILKIRIKRTLSTAVIVTNIAYTRFASLGFDAFVELVADESFPAKAALLAYRREYCIASFADGVGATSAVALAFYFTDWDDIFEVDRTFLCEHALLGGWISEVVFLAKATTSAFLVAFHREKLRLTVIALAAAIFVLFIFFTSLDSGTILPFHASVLDLVQNIAFCTLTQVGRDVAVNAKTVVVANSRLPADFGAHVIALDGVLAGGHARATAFLVDLVFQRARRLDFAFFFRLAHA